MGEQLKQQTLYDILEQNSKNIFWVDRYVSGPEGSGGTYESRRMTQDQLLELMQNNLSFNTGTKTFKNVTGYTIPKGNVVGLDVISGGVVTAVPMDSSSDGSGSQLYVATEDVVNNASGSFIEEGVITGFNTSSFAVGDWLYWNPTTETIDTSAEADKMFLGVVVTQNVSGTIYVSPTRNYSLVTGNAGQVALFVGTNHIESNSRFTFINNVGVEVGFRFDDGNNNLTQIGCTYANIESEGIASNSVLRLANWSTGATKGIVSFRKARGSKSAPSQVKTDDVLGAIIYTGQTDDGGGSTVAEVEVVAKQDFVRDQFSDYPFTDRYALTEFRIKLASGFDQAFDTTVIPNNIVFRVDGNGVVYFKNYKFPATDGTVGQILKTNGAGVLTWQSGVGVIDGGGAVNRLAFWADADTLMYSDLLQSYLGGTSGNKWGIFRVLSDAGVGNTVQEMYLGTYNCFTDANSRSSQILLGTRGDNTYQSMVRLQYINSGFTYAQNGNVLGVFSFSADVENDVASIKSIVTENHSGTARGNKLEFYITKNTTNVRFLALLLDSDGKVKISNAYKLPLTDGSNGQVMKTDGAGVLSWANSVLGSGATNKIAFWSDSATVGYDSNLLRGTNAGDSFLQTLGTNVDVTVGGGSVGSGIDVRSNSVGIIAVYSYGTSVSPVISIQRRRGTKSSSSGHLSGDTIGSIQFNNVGVIKVNATEDNSTGYGNEVIFSTGVTGTSTQQEVLKLTQDKKVKVSGVYLLPNTDGTANQVMKTDGSGDLSWVDSSTLAGSVYNIGANECFRGHEFTNNSTTLNTNNIGAPSTSASVLALTVSNTDFRTKTIRLRYYHSVISTGHYCGTRGTALLWYLGSGFRYVCSFSVSDTVYSSGSRQFYGMAGVTTDLTYTDVTTVASMTNIIGIGSESTDTNLQFFYNDASGTASKIDLGASFVANRTAGAIMTTIYEVQILNLPNTTTVYYRVVNKETGAIASGSVSTDLPATTQGLNYFASRCLGGGGGLTNAGQFDLSGKLGVYSLF